MGNFGVTISLNIERTKLAFGNIINESRNNTDNLFYQAQTTVKKGQECSVSEIVASDIQVACGNYENLIKEQELRKQILNQICLLSENQDLEEEERLLYEIEKLEAVCCRIGKGIQDRRSSLKKLEEEKSGIFFQIMKYLNLFSVLGLDVVQVDDVLQLAFKFISMNDLNGIYKLGLKIVDNVFQVVDCVPVVKTLDQLIADLNETRNFIRFIIKLRTEFIGIANIDRIN